MHQSPVDTSDHRPTGFTPVGPEHGDDFIAMRFLFTPANHVAESLVVTVTFVPFAADLAVASKSVPARRCV